jgi:hypothetical protein
VIYMVDELCNEAVNVFAQQTTSGVDKRGDIVGGCGMRPLSNTALVLSSRQQFSQQRALRDLPCEVHDVIPLPSIDPVVARHP